MRGKNLYFLNGIPAVEFINELLDWVDSANLGDKRKIKYKHYITHYGLAAVREEGYMINLHPMSNDKSHNFKEFWNYATWLSNKLKKPLPESVQYRFFAHSL